MKKNRLVGRRSTMRGVVAVMVLGVGLVGLPDGARAGNGVVPESCKLHHNKVLNPGCLPSLAEQVNDEVEGATGYEIAYPDLVPDVTEVLVQRPIYWDFELQEIAYGPPELAFDTYAQNLGQVPVDLLADDPTNQAGSTVSQCVGWTTDFVCRERVQVGGFTWHDEHSHFHFADFGHYEFRRTLPDSSPDYSAAGLVDISEKVSFCLLDSDIVRDDALPVARYRQCDAINQGISPGWADIYGSGLPGQQFPLTGVPDGRYVVIVDMDTSNYLFETDDVHNRVEITVDITTSPDSAVIVSRRHL